MKKNNTFEFTKHKTEEAFTSYVVQQDKPVKIIHAGRNQARE